MVNRILADAVLVLHLMFVLYAVFGGLLILKWRFTVWLHLPALLWAIAIELGGWICPLTYLENSLRTSAGQGGYTESFVEHYVLPVLYPVGLSRDDQILLAAVLAVINIAVYGIVYINRRKSQE